MAEQQPPAGGDFVSVPVPAQYVIDVHKFLGQLRAEAPEAAAVSTLEVDGIETVDEEVDGARWTVDELARFAASGTKTAVTIAAVLDVITQEPGRLTPTSELATLTGIPAANIKGAMTGLTRTIKAHYTGRSWPFEWKWGPNLGQGYPAETHYCATPEQAKLWKEARSA